MAPEGSCRSYVDPSLEILQRVQSVLSSPAQCQYSFKDSSISGNSVDINMLEVLETETADG